VFPVRFPDGQVILRTGSEGFALIDRKTLGEDFATLAKFLDFSMNEVRILQPLIHWAGFEDRYLSKSVKEITLRTRNPRAPSHHLTAISGEKHTIYSGTLAPVH
jgi:hypothetical protein